MWKRLPNDLTTILEQFAPYHTEMKGLVVESTYNWYWLVDGLMEADYRIHLANPAAIQQDSGLNAYLPGKASLHVSVVTSCQTMRVHSLRSTSRSPLDEGNTQR